jgi:hypothetical protein
MISPASRPHRERTPRRGRGRPHCRSRSPTPSPVTCDRSWWPATARPPSGWSPACRVKGSIRPWVWFDAHGPHTPDSNTSNYLPGPYGRCSGTATTRSPGRPIPANRLGTRRRTTPRHADIVIHRPQSTLHVAQVNERRLPRLAGCCSDSSIRQGAKHRFVDQEPAGGSGMPRRAASNVKTPASTGCPALAT